MRFDPGDLAVEMRVDVDKARRDQLALGVDLFGARAGDLTDLRDLAVADRDVALERFAAAAVGDRPAAHHEVEFRHGVPPSCIRRFTSLGPAALLSSHTRPRRWPGMQAGENARTCDAASRRRQ